MFIDMPYFMKNEAWYFFDRKKKKYVLTEKATDEAKESYRDFYKEVNSKKVKKNGKGG